MVAWTGPGRTVLDRIAPFSLYRTLTGSAFLFVTMEFLAAGIDVNDRTFEALKRAASPYARHRIAAIQGHMARGVGLGRSMVLAGHGFPDPSLVPVVAALDGAPGWERKLARFRGALGGALGRAAARPRGPSQRDASDCGGTGHGLGHRRDVLDPRTGRPVLTEEKDMDGTIETGARVRRGAS